MQIELWQVPLLVVAGIVAVDLIARATMKSLQLATLRRKQLKTASLVILFLIMTLLLWPALLLFGTSTMANIAAIVSVLIELGALWLAHQAYQEIKATQATQAAVTDSEKEGGRVN